MRVRITSPSMGVASSRPITYTNSRGQTVNAKQKVAKNGTSAAFLVSVMDASDIDSNLISFTRVCPDTGVEVSRDSFNGAYEMWFPLDRSATGEACDLDNSFASAILRKMSEFHSKGAFLTFEFEPVFGPNSRQNPVYGQGDNAARLYQTITIGFNNYGVKRFTEARPTAVEGL